MSRLASKAFRWSILGSNTLSHRSRTFASSSHHRASEVQIVEVGPRDGLQNERTSIPLDTKLELIQRLSNTGIKSIESGSFVSPKWVPQMADSAEVLATLLKHPASQQPRAYHWLVPNEKGLDNFLATYDTVPSASSSTENPGHHHISIFASATETFSLKNTNRSIAESVKAFAPLIIKARAHALPVRAYISVALGCPYEGPSVSPHAVAELATSLLSLGADQISIADTTGMGTPRRTAELLKTLHAAGVRNEDLAMHFHDTYGHALVNALVSLDQGVVCFDSAVAGLGGCPFSPGATGNVSTEDMVYFLQGLGLHTGVDLQEMTKVGDWISGELGRENESRTGKALLARV